MLRSVSGWIPSFRRVGIKRDLYKSTRIVKPALQLESTRRFSSTNKINITTNNTYDDRLHYQQELQALSQEILFHDDLYYNGHEPALTDDEYDALVARQAQLSSLKRTTVGAPIANNNNSRVKRQHLQPMLSLDNVHTTTELQQWLERIRKHVLKDNVDNINNTRNDTTIKILTEPKLDGLSCSLRYEQSTLRWAATRGDGSQGHDVTSAIRQHVPNRIGISAATDTTQQQERGVVEVRGEILLPKSAFATLTSWNFSNARNAASGILLRKEQLGDNDADNTRELRSQLRFFAYEIVVDNGDDTMLDAADTRRLLEHWGFAVATPYQESNLVVDANRPWDESDLPDLLKYYAELQNHRNDQPSALAWGDYDMDGCVHKVAQGRLRAQLGSSNRAPRWAVAHKFPAQAAMTELVGIDVQVGRTGALTPVAILKPVDLGGVTVQRATLHNFQHMQQVLGGGGDKEQIPKGCLVFVRRAGDVIPQVVSRAPLSTTKSKDFISLAAPAKCPSCGSETVFDSLTTSSGSANNQTLGQVLRCGGPPLLCSPRASLALKHAYSRDALDLTGLSEARVRQLMEAALIQLPSDVFVIAKDADKLKQVAALEGWGEKSAQNLATVSNRIATEGVSLSRFIYALGLRFVGVHSASLIASVYGSGDAFLNDLQHSFDKRDSDNVTDVPFARLREATEMTKGIGPAILDSLVDFARQEYLVKVAFELRKHVRVLDEARQDGLSIASSNQTDTSSQDLPFKGMGVVFTGSFTDLTRSEVKKLAKLMGAKKTSTSVSKSTHLVIVGKCSGKNLQMARNYEVPIMQAEEFLAMAEPFRK
jgi:DNA ligase (NAD+)